MELTDKCKEAFEKWNSENNYGAYKFEDFNDSMKYGVYVDFFDSVGIPISQSTQIDRLRLYSSFSIKGVIEMHKTRNEARKAAIQKANEIFNQ